MSTDPGQHDDGKRGVLVAVGLVVLPILCCGLPVLIAAGALGTVGSALGNPWIIAFAGSLVLGLVVWRVRGRTRS